MRRIKFIILGIFSAFLLFSGVACKSDNKGKVGKVEHNFSVNVSNITLELGESFQIIAAYGAEKLTYQADNSSIATVSETGLVETISEGTVYITISAKEEHRTCKITVVKYDYSIRLDFDSIIMVVGAKKKLTATLLRDGESYDGQVRWETTGGKIDADGEQAVFTATEKGEYKVTVSDEKGNKSFCEFTVVETLGDLSN